MKAAFAIVVLLALSQTAFTRPSAELARSRADDCLERLKNNLVRHVDELGEWGQEFVAKIVAVQATLNYGREACDQIPPSIIRDYLFDQCVNLNDELRKLESERIRSELEAKVNKQPEILKEFLIEFTLCLLGRN